MNRRRGREQIRGGSRVPTTVEVEALKGKSETSLSAQRNYCTPLIIFSARIMLR